MRKAALVLSLLPAIVAILGFAVLVIETRLRSVASSFSYNLPVLIVGVLFLALALLAWRKPLLGGLLLIGFGAMMLLLATALVFSEADPVVYLTTALPFCLAIVVSGVLYVKVAMAVRGAGGR